MNTNLSSAEIAYVRRFCYETATNYKNFGPGSIFDHCREHSRDLESLAIATGIQFDVLEEIENGREAPSLVDFPWSSFDHLAERAQQVQQTERS
jgi:hypothetical protein